MRDFRNAWGLDPSFIFLNHGSYGACPSAVLEFQAAFRRQLESQPVRFFRREYLPLLKAARESFAEFIKVPPSQLAFTSSVTPALTAILGNLSLQAGDEILTSIYNYQACNNALAYFAEKHRATLKFIELPFPPHSPSELVEAYAQAITPKTRLALVDHVLAPLGMILPVREISEMLREKGILSIIDGAHAPGMLPVDVSAIPCDFYLGNGHKWLCGPKGVGFIVVKKDLPNLRGLVIGHGVTTADPTRSLWQKDFDWPGTFDPSAFLCLPKAVEFLRELVSGSWEDIYTRNHTLIRKGYERLCEVLQVPVNERLAEEFYGSMVAIPLNTEEFVPTSLSVWDIHPLQELLFTKYRIEVPVIQWARPHRLFLRISGHLHNTEADYEALAQALSRERN